MKRHAGIATPALDAGDRSRGRRRPAAGRGRPAAGRGRPAQAGQVPAAGPAQQATVTVKRHPIRVGSVTIPPCASSPLAWCTRINVPYQYVGRDPGAAGTIKLGFQWYPATSGRAAGTILAVQGGPGYATTDYAGQYRTLFRPLLSRATCCWSTCAAPGIPPRSPAGPCRAGRRPTASRPTPPTPASAAGSSTTPARLKGGGGYVQASDLYTTADAARDVALLLRRLQTGRIDLYGDSYGTYFSQVFTARYARMLRSVTLDSAYPVTQHDPWYRSTIRTARRAFPLACLRSVACHAAAPGSSWARIVRLRQLPASSSGHRPDQDCLRPGRHRAGRRQPADRAGQQRRHGQHRVPRARSRGPGAARRG